MDFVISWMAPLIPGSGLSDGDFLYLAAALGVATCPGAPCLPFMAGRTKALRPAFISGVPTASDSVDDILSRFADVGIISSEVVSLMGAPSIAADYLTDKNINGKFFEF